MAKHPDRFLTWKCRNTATVSFLLMGRKGYAIHSPNAHRHIIYHPVPPHSCFHGDNHSYLILFCLWGWRTLTTPKMLERFSHSRGYMYYNTVLHNTMAGVTYKESSMPQGNVIGGISSCNDWRDSSSPQRWSLVLQGSLTSYLHITRSKPITVCHWNV